MKLSKKGQSLIEVVLGVAVAIIVIYALVALATLSMTYAQSALRRSEASKLANAGMEAFRLERDTSGFSSSCLDENPLVTYIIDASPSCNFIRLDPLSREEEEIVVRTGVAYFRKMVIEDAGSGKKNFKVSVFWVEGSSQRRVTMSGLLTDWR